MNILKSFIVLAALSFPLVSSASDFLCLTFKMTDGSEVAVVASGLTMNYSNGELVLKSATVNRTFSINQLRSMRFTTSGAGVEGIQEAVLSDADYYDLSGKMLGRYADVEAARGALPSGTYIVRGKDKSIKIIF